MSLIEQPEDHKHKIFSYLPLVDLIQLGFASKGSISKLIDKGK